ncbi:hypothetical protein [Pyxidicoccus sp. MSG2]|nr:hypothetical protein [Pyxidicoccus sp. MSG2]MCY1020040.1 hypothetical protein [Pyxidicoccus sp. MSG2]
MNKNRLEAFSDGVITLMVLELKAPLCLPKIQSLRHECVKTRVMT